MVVFEGRMVAAAADDGAQKQQKHIATATVVYAESVYEDCVMNDAVWHHAQQTQKPKTAEEPKSILQNYAVSCGKVLANENPEFGLFLGA